MNATELLTNLSAQCTRLHALLAAASHELAVLHKRLEQIVQQLRKNIEVRDQLFSEQFNEFCQKLRTQVDEWDPQWTQLRAKARELKPQDWGADLALAAKGFNSQARALSRAQDEFTGIYDAFNRTYKSFTAAKLNVFLLTSCQTDTENLTSKILFLAREIAKYTEKNRGTYVR